MSRHVWLFLMAFSCFVQLNCIVSFAQDAVHIRLVRSAESWTETVPVSGDFISGLAYSGGDFSLASGKVSLFGPKLYRGYICLVVSTRDGRYSGNWLFDVRLSEEGVGTLDLNSKYQREIEKFAVQDIALLAFETADDKENCRFSQHPVFRIGYGDSLPNLPITLLISSGMVSTRVFVWNEETDLPKRFSCDRISNPQSIAFDTACVIPGDIAVHAKKIGIRWSDGSSAIRKIELEVK